MSGFPLCTSETPLQWIQVKQKNDSKIYVSKLNCWGTGRNFRIIQTGVGSVFGWFHPSARTVEFDDYFTNLHLPEMSDHLGEDSPKLELPERVRLVS